MTLSDPESHFSCLRLILRKI